MSLRTKFLSLLVVVPSIALILFLYFAYTTFVDDKKLYLFEKQFQQLNASKIFLEGVTFDFLSKKMNGVLQQDGFENFYIVDDQGTVIISQNEKLSKISFREVIGESAFEKLASQSTAEGSFLAPDKSGKETLVSFLKLEIEAIPYTLVLFTPLQGATRASIMFLFKAMSAFVVLLAISILVSVVYSNRLTRGLHSLAFAMQRFGNDGSEVSLKAETTDEVGAMTMQFVKMRKQITALISDQQKKARLESEVQLAGRLQDRFFPAKNFVARNVNLSGFFEPAATIGGSWWFYFLKDNTLVVVIADSIGHGLNSAMLTAVSRSAFSFIEKNYTSTSESMKILNRAIFDSTRGELNMTATILAINVENGAISYSVAAHQPPILFPSTDDKGGSNVANMIKCPSEKKLGQVRDHEFNEGVYQLSEGDCVLLYSNGLTSLKDKNGTDLGEARIVSSIFNGNKKSQNSSDILRRVLKTVNEHREGSPLVDDLSFLIIQWRKA